jgi:GntR family transcriptional regulator/MocR family aminotransferase
MPPATFSLAFDFAGIQLDPKQGLSRQLYQALRQRVLDGSLDSGMRLPASRDLASALGISRNSVMRAYDQLLAEGFIEGRIGDGTYVAQLRKQGTGVKKLSTQVSTGLVTGLSTGLSTINSNIAADSADLVIHKPAIERLNLHHLSAVKTGAPRAFRVGLPAVDLFPFTVWGKLQAAFWRRPDLHLLGYGDPAGERRLRELIAVYLKTSRGLHCSAEQIVITSGAQQAITLCAQLLLTPGDEVAVENPGYRAAGHAFGIAGATLRGVSVDSEGMCCRELEGTNSIPDGGHDEPEPPSGITGMGGAYRWLDR